MKSVGDRDAWEGSWNCALAVNEIYSERFARELGVVDVFVVGIHGFANAAQGESGGAQGERDAQRRGKVG